MIVALLLAAQSIVTFAPPLKKARPATSWSCDFNNVDGTPFKLTGTFPEIPAGSNANDAHPVAIAGNGPEPLVGRVSYNAFESYSDSRFYQAYASGADGSHYVINFALLQGESIGMANVTRYMSDPGKVSGKLTAFAVGHCAATFLPIGYKGKGK